MGGPGTPPFWRTSSVRYGTRLGDLKESWPGLFCFPIKHSTHTETWQIANGNVIECRKTIFPDSNIAKNTIFESGFDQQNSETRVFLRVHPFLPIAPCQSVSRLKYRVAHGSQPRHGWAPDPLMVEIRSPIGLVVGSCTSHPGVLGSIPKREEPGKTGAPDKN